MIDAPTLDARPPRQLTPAQVRRLVEEAAAGPRRTAVDLLVEGVHALLEQRARRPRRRR